MIKTKKLSELVRNAVVKAGLGKLKSMTNIGYCPTDPGEKQIGISIYVAEETKGSHIFCIYNEKTDEFTTPRYKGGPFLEKPLRKAMEFFKSALNSYKKVNVEEELNKEDSAEKTALESRVVIVS